MHVGGKRLPKLGSLAVQRPFGRPVSGIARDSRGALSVVTLNPFTYGNPISDPSRFVGRQREVEQIFMRLRNPEFESSSLVGERRSGKTSLLNFIAHPDTVRAYGLDSATYLFVYLDLEMITSTSTPTRLYQYMLDSLVTRPV